MEQIGTAAVVALALLGAVGFAACMLDRIGYWDRPSEWDRKWDEDGKGGPSDEL